MRRPCAWCCFVVSALPLYGQDRPGGLPADWEVVDATPAWVAGPPALAGTFRFATWERSDQLEIAKVRALDLAERDGMQVLVEQFTPALGSEVAQQLAAAAWQRRKIVHASMRLEREAPRNLATAWLLWEVPVRACVDTLPAALRGRAERAMLRPPLPWADVDQAPAWVGKPQHRDDWFGCVLTHEAEWHAEARELAAKAARSDVVAEIVRRLRPVLGDPAAATAAAAAVEDLHPVARALWFRKLDQPVGKRRYATTVWVHWEVPISRILATVPEDRHAAVRERLAAAQ